jgi:hypothetical protein
VKFYEAFPPKRAEASHLPLFGVPRQDIREGGVTDSFGRPLSAIRDGLGFLKGSACPHYDGETDRRRTHNDCQPRHHRSQRHMLND